MAPAAPEAGVQSESKPPQAEFQEDISAVEFCEPSHTQSASDRNKGRPQRAMAAVVEKVDKLVGDTTLSSSVEMLCMNVSPTASLTSSAVGYMGKFAVALVQRVIKIMDTKGHNCLGAIRRVLVG